MKKSFTVPMIRELIADGVKTTINEKNLIENEVIKSTIDGVKLSIIDEIKSVVSENKPTVNEVVKPVVCEFRPIIDYYPQSHHYHGNPCHSGYNAGWNRCDSGHKVMFNMLPDTGHFEYFY